MVLKKVTLPFIKDVAKAILFFRRPKFDRPDFRGKKIVFANTINNYETIKFLLAKYPDAILITTGNYVKKTKKAVNVRKFLSSAGQLKKYLFMLYLGVHPAYRLRNYQYILKAFGYVSSYISLLKENQPGCIFVSNDHYPDSRALMLAAKKLGIKCIYIQHASVTPGLPPMRASHALLYGEYSEHVYRLIGDTDSKLIQIGNHRFDYMGEMVLNKKPTGNIGIAFNTLDSIDEVLNLSEYMAQFFPAQNIMLRAHPAEKRKFQTRFSISKPTAETSIEFLNKLDVLITGNSSISLEAAAMNVYPFQYNFGIPSAYWLDYYGFIKNGVVTEVKDKESLIEKIKEVLQSGRFEARPKTKVYDASVGKPYEFSVEQRLTTVIDEILLS